MLFLTIYFRDRPDAEKAFLDNVTHNFLPREGYPSGSQHCPGEGFFCGRIWMVYQHVIFCMANDKKKACLQFGCVVVDADKVRADVHTMCSDKPSSLSK